MLWLASLRFAYLLFLWSTIDYALNCPTGGFPTLRHNGLRDFILTKVCSEVRVKPPLQLLTGKTLRYATANNEDGAYVDVSATGFWGSKHQS